MARTGMLIRILISSIVTSLQASYLTPTPAPFPTPMPILRRSSRDVETKHSSMILAGMSSTVIASIIRIIVRVATPRHDLQQLSMMFAGSTKLRAIAQMSHIHRAKQRIEFTKITVHGP